MMTLYYKQCFQLTDLLSMYSKLFMESGISYSELVDRLIGFALERK